MGETQRKLEQPPHVAIVPIGGMGHFIPLVEFAKRLVVHHNFNVTLIIPSNGSPMTRQKEILEAIPSEITIPTIFLPHVSFDDLPNHTPIEARIALVLTRSLPALRDQLKNLAESTRLQALVVDLFGGEAFDVAKEFNIPSYMFFAMNAMVLSFGFLLPKLDEATTCEYRDLPEPVAFPGCVPVRGSDFTDSVQDRKSEAYKAIMKITKTFTLPAGIIVNSFMDLEPGALNAFKEVEEGRSLPPVYPVGPIIQTYELDGQQESLFGWLDKQPNRSVLFVSFGSGGTFTQEQMNELAFGLEMSGQRFLWVVSSPNEKSKSGTYFGTQNTENALSFLPIGFVERTKEVALVLASWVPQVQVLSHASIGGFVTHCGWNSILEGIVHGVPLIAWPLFAEQRTNAVLVADDLKVALRVKVNHKGVVERQDIAECAKGVIQGDVGKLLQRKMKEFKVKAGMALSEQGSSTKSLVQVTQIWKNHQKP